jgi:hypothetical protein
LGKTFRVFLCLGQKRRLENFILSGDFLILSHAKRVSGQIRQDVGKRKLHRRFHRIGQKQTAILFRERSVKLLRRDSHFTAR